MLNTAFIVFREVLEIALVLGIVMAATRGMKGRAFIAFAGLGLGIIGAGLIAFFTESISQAIDGVGQEVFNAGVLFIAVGFLSWTVIWMKRHGRDMAKNISAMGQDVKQGNRSIYALILVIALGTLREGAEVVLFTYGMTASGAISIASVIAGGLLGLVGGTIVGVMLYFGLLKTVKRHLFTVTSWMLIVLTAGMAAQGANFLIAAGILPELYPQVWDTSAFVSGDGMIGKTLSVLVGYTPRPTGMELCFYLSVLITIGIAYKFVGSKKPAVVLAAAPVVGNGAVAAE